MDDEDDLPLPTLDEPEEDLWSRAAKGIAPVAGPHLELFDAELSLRLANSNDAAWAYWEQHKDRYPKIRDVLTRIDFDAATELEDRLWRELAARREQELERIRASPKHPGVRQDQEHLRQLVMVKARTLSIRQRQVYELCIDRGFSVNQCAEALGIGRETVRTYLRRLRSAMPAAWRAQQPA